MPETPNLDLAVAIRTLTDLGRAQGAPLTVPGAPPLVVLPEQYKVKSLEEFLPPRFVKEAVTLKDARSFIAYVNAFKANSVGGPNNTVIFAEVGGAMRLTAVLDFHTPNTAPSAPGRCAHVAVFAPPLSQEWQAWTAADRKAMTQEQFALFLEENDAVFKTPGGADLLELIIVLEGKADVNFSQGIKLQNGTIQLKWEEDTNLRGGVGTGQIDIPGKLVVLIPPFEGDAPFQFEARLRYKISSRKVTFHYESIRLDRVLRDAADAIVRRVAEETQVPIYHGKR